MCWEFFFFCRNQDGIDILYIIDVATGRKFQVDDTPKGEILSLHWHPVDNNSLALTFSTSCSPGNVFVLDLHTHKVIQWTEAEIGGLNSDHLVEPELIRYETFDEVSPGKKRTISAYYYKPHKVEGKLPVILYFHGGPEDQIR